MTAGDPLVELETEKIDLEVSADRAGVLADIKHQEGADVKVGEVLAVLEESTNGSTGGSRTGSRGSKGSRRAKGSSVPKAVARFFREEGDADREERRESAQT